MSVLLGFRHELLRIIEIAPLLLGGAIAAIAGCNLWNFGWRTPGNTRRG